MDEQHERRDPVEAAYERICDAALVERVRAFVEERRPDNPWGVPFEIDADVAVALGVTATQPVAEWASLAAPGLVLERSYPYQVLRYLVATILLEENAEAWGEHERAAKARERQLLAARDVRRGVLSEELQARVAEDDEGIDSEPVLTDEEYDAECRARGNIEIGDAWATDFRLVRDTSGHCNGHRPVVLRQPRQARPRGRRATRSARSTRGSPDPSRPRPRRDVARSGGRR
jgi:hypothetical protein